MSWLASALQPLDNVAVLMLKVTQGCPMASNTLPPGCTMHHAIGVVDTPHGRGLRATEPIKAGEVLLYAPAAAQLDGIDADALATTLLAELEKGTHQWLSSLPRVAYSAAGCDDATPVSYTHLTLPTICSV